MNRRPGTTRALGWDTPTRGLSSAGDYFSPNSIGHLGFTGCSLWIDLLQKVTVILCTNRVHPTRNATGITRLRPAVHNAIMRALGERSGNLYTARSTAARLDTTTSPAPNWRGEMAVRSTGVQYEE